MLIGNLLLPALALLVPGIELWLRGYREYNASRHLIWALRKIFRTPLPLRSMNSENQGRISPKEMDNRTAKLVESTFQRLVGLHVIVMSFGLAVPFVALVAAVSICMVVLDFCHHLGELAIAAVEFQIERSPLLKGKIGLSRTTNVWMAGSTALLWAVTSLGYLRVDQVAIGACFGVGGVLLTWGCWKAIIILLRRRNATESRLGLGASEVTASVVENPIIHTEQSSFNHRESG